MHVTNTKCYLGHLSLLLFLHPPLLSTCGQMITNCNAVLGTNIIHSTMNYEQCMCPFMTTSYYLLACITFSLRKWLRERWMMPWITSTNLY